MLGLYRVLEVDSEKGVRLCAGNVSTGKIESEDTFSLGELDGLLFNKHRIAPRNFNFR